MFQGSNTPQQITVQSEDGQMLTLNPETIIVQQSEGGEVVVTSSNPAEEPTSQQYVIQYIDEGQPNQQVDLNVHVHCRAYQ